MLYTLHCVYRYIHLWQLCTLIRCHLLLYQSSVWVTVKLKWNAEQKYKGQIWCYLEHHNSKIGSEKLKLVLICVCELQKLAIIAMKSLSI